MRLSRTWEHKDERLKDRFSEFICEDYLASLKLELSKFISSDEIANLETKSN